MLIPSYIECRIAFLIAFFLILIGAALSVSNQGGEGDDCSVLQPRVFARAVVLSLASVVLEIVYYLALDSRKSRNGSCDGTPATPNQSGIAMSKPQVPPPQFPPPQVPPPNTEAAVSVHTCFCLLCQHQQNVSRPE
ncbi:hypothetical protein Vadar_031934 [Vaccinium darrowii]|uniref:Uncharacterized protein n=1 Tax=Vaccinium darrowii TaxID=229202 RepID=A0ACB7Z7R9_9ERIC|nr:hypothetical protein Vadar_031934 [Vaccinium darrowii]